MGGVLRLLRHARASTPDSATTFSLLLILSGIASAFTACLHDEHPRAARLTGWDVALLLLGLSLAIEILFPAGSSGTAVNLMAAPAL